MSRLLCIVVASVAVGLVACGETPTSPTTKREYTLSFDSNPVGLTTNVGSRLSFPVQATLWGGVDFRPGDFLHSLDNSSVAQVSKGEVSLEYSYTSSGFAGGIQDFLKTLYKQTFEFEGLSKGTAVVDVWHPSDPRKKRTVTIVVN